MPHKIFIAHGRNTQILEEVEKFIRSLDDLEPVILENEANLGKTIIEKLEEKSRDVEFAIIILSEDDFGVFCGDNDMDFLRHMAGHIHWLAEMYRLVGGSHPGPIPLEFVEKYRKLAILLSEMRFRARQNVILEMGYFLAKFRESGRIAILRSQNVEIPSNITGIVYSENENWMSSLKTDLITSGILQSG